MPAATSPLLPRLSPSVNEERLSLGLQRNVLHLFKRSKLNFLLFFVPISWLTGALQMSPVLIFWINFLAIIPMADILGHSTEQIALKTNESIGGLLNATFGNAVELIISIMALYRGLIKIVQTSLLGSIFANLLLVNGCCFLFGGLRHKEQQFNVSAANTSTSLLAISVMSLLVPAAFVATLTEKNPSALLNLSYGTAMVLLCIYFFYLLFQFKTHAHLYSSAAEEEGSDDEEELGNWSLTFSSSVLLLTTLLISIHSDAMVGSIEGFTEQWGLSHSFIGIILLPIVGNATEHLSSVTMAMKNKMNLALSISIGSSMQIALFLIPMMVVLGRILNQPMSLFFETFETTVLAISVLIVNYLIQDGSSNWLEGAMLLGSYGIVAIAFYFHP